MREFIEMCEVLDGIEGVRTWIQGDTVFANGIEIRTTVNFDDLGNYKYIVVHESKFSEEMNFFDALWFAETVIRGRNDATNNDKAC